MGLRRARFNGALVGYDREGAVDPADVAWLDELRPAETLVDSCEPDDLVVLAMPVAAIESELAGPLRRLPSTICVTDVGSTKRAICAAASGMTASFVGGHPFAGSHRAGAGAARADLFDGARWFVVGHNASPTAVGRVQELAMSLGAVPTLIDADEHDRLMAARSHLPQLLSTLLAATAAGPDAGGPAWESMTRLASSPWSMWEGILATNAGPLVEAIDSFSAALASARTALAEGSIDRVRSLFGVR
jgi:prephenate dehydrogenase